MKWINAEDKPPPHDKPFLGVLWGRSIVYTQYTKHYDVPVYGPPGKYEFYCCIDNIGEESEFEIRTEEKPFTHWMELPELPEKDSKDHIRDVKKKDSDEHR